MKIMLAFARQGIVLAFSYKIAYWMGLFNTIIKIFVFYSLWYFLHEQNPNIFPVIKEQILAYGVISVIISDLIEWWDGPHFYIGRQIRLGLITTDLLKPVYFPLQVFHLWTGNRIAKIVTTIFPAIIIVNLLLPLSLPHSILTVAQSVLSIFFAYLIVYSLNFLVGMLCFRTINMMGIMHAYHALIMLFSGMLIPLWFYPDWLRGVCELLPFSGLFYIPLSIYIGNIVEADAWNSIAFQFVWLLILIIVCQIVWLRTHKHLVIQGG
ncbi:ABC-2 family transporter protein [Paenibacillus thiaminolyticus]|nr:ABC-2 family transporter protein [Paenibacillus thiaminolyticus]